MHFPRPGVENENENEDDWECTLHRAKHVRPSSLRGALPMWDCFTGLHPGRLPEMSKLQSRDCIPGSGISGLRPGLRPRAPFAFGRNNLLEMSKLQIRALSAEVKADGRIHVEGRGLLLAGGNAIGTNGGQSVFATLICGPLPNGPFTVHSTPVANAVALAADGDFTIDDILSPTPSNDCDNPVLLIRNVGGAWFAASIPLVIE